MGACSKRRCALATGAARWFGQVASTEEAEKLFKALGRESNYEFELKHKVIIGRFGRYPHRNTILGRDSTAEEVEFLQQPGASF